ncbi:uncharacterized protein DUF3500 [Kineococcus rhizosphaerae]|uniref:Uncharacterized protein DUF3500 n=2 Tax=Kineococcus rhizosphaerae TaxID=559628 RepID=A0A2T0QP70_9ACTN|nr:uncharacterized protein DUF3500 [Kineococcus rhizosphaerae]
MAGAGAAAFAVMGATAANAADTPTAPPTGGTDPGAGGGGGTTETLDEFVGLTTDGTVVTDLYSIHSTGVSTAPVVAAAAAFLSSLTDAQRTATVFEIDPTDYTTDQFRLWSNIHSYTRQGVEVSTLTAAQLLAGRELLAAGLSARGLTLSENIRRVNGIAGVQLNQTDQFYEGRYNFTIMGTPSETDPWGWQFEGHHQVINYFVLGDQVVMTPTFWGSEPTTIANETYGTITLFDEEIEAALAAVNSLTTAQQATAVISATKTGDDNVAEAFKDNVEVPYVGILLSDLTTAQQDLMLELIWLFVYTQKGDHAEIRFDEIKQYLTQTYFAWKGPTDVDAVFWFRFQSPVFYLEFDCETPGPVGQGYGDAQVPSRKHIHSIMRTPNGNDYGKALLALHLATAAHHN